MSELLIIAHCLLSIKGKMLPQNSIVRRCLQIFIGVKKYINKQNWCLSGIEITFVGKDPCVIENEANIFLS